MKKGFAKSNNANMRLEPKGKPMTSKLKCPFCGQELIREGMNHWWCSCNIEHQGKELYGTTALWQALIQSQQQLKMLEPIVASLQGRADINAEVARDSNELVVQWYEKYEQSQKDLEIARKALVFVKALNERQDGCFEEDYETQMRTVYKALEQIDHIADVSKMVEHKEK